MMDDDSPCNDCPFFDSCDAWEAEFCCTLCEYYGSGNEDDCDNCDKFDI